MIPKGMTSDMFQETTFDYNGGLGTNTTKELIKFNDNVYNGGSISQQINPVTGGILPPPLGVVTTPTKGTSVIIDPLVVLPQPPKEFPIKGLPNLDSLLTSPGSPSEDITENTSTSDTIEPTKKKFPYWIIAVAVVGGYLVFRKK